MTAVVVPAARTAARDRTSSVVLALAATELRRTLRNPVVALGLGLSIWLLWTMSPDSEAWAGVTYTGMAIASAPLLLAISLVTAVSFHRERTAVAPDAPVRGTVRAMARLVAATPLIGIAAAFTALIGWRQRDLGGLVLGTEPGRTAEALHSTAELAQHVVLAILAVALGAALGRRVAHLAAIIPLLFIVWYLVAGIYWLFVHPAVLPFSVVQVQPVMVHIGPGSADPLSFPETWLLEPPGEYQEGWGRLVVSPALAWWHAVWLLGLSSLHLALAVPGRTARRWLVVGGLSVAVLGVVAQFQVFP